MAFEDKNLKCKECGADFVWTAGEQQFYADKGFENPPFRCPECRRKKKEQKMSDRANRPLYDITCKQCGKQGQVPFEPRDPNDVLCAECFKQSRQQS